MQVPTAPGGNADIALTLGSVPRTTVYGVSKKVGFLGRCAALPVLANSTKTEVQHRL